MPVSGEKFVRPFVVEPPNVYFIAIDIAFVVR